MRGHTPAAPPLPPRAQPHNVETDTFLIASSTDTHLAENPRAVPSSSTEKVATRTPGGHPHLSWVPNQIPSIRAAACALVPNRPPPHRHEHRRHDSRREPSGGWEGEEACSHAIVRHRHGGDVAAGPEQDVEHCAAEAFGDGGGVSGGGGCGTRRRTRRRRCRGCVRGGRRHSPCLALLPPERSPPSPQKRRWRQRRWRRHLGRRRRRRGGHRRGQPFRYDKLVPPASTSAMAPDRGEHEHPTPP